MSLTTVFFTSRSAHVMEIASCVYLADRVKAGEYWLGKFVLPLLRLVKRSDLPTGFRCNGTESHAHVEAKYSALAFFESIGFSVQTEDQGWDLSAKRGEEILRIECGTTPTERLRSLWNGAASGFVVVTMPLYGSLELPTYLFTRPTPITATEEWSNG